MRSRSALKQGARSLLPPQAAFYGHAWTEPSALLSPRPHSSPPPGARSERCLRVFRAPFAALPVRGSGLGAAAVPTELRGGPALPSRAPRRAAGTRSRRRFPCPPPAFFCSTFCPFSSPRRGGRPRGGGREKSRLDPALTEGGTRRTSRPASALLGCPQRARPGARGLPSICREPQRGAAGPWGAP